MTYINCKLVAGIHRAGGRGGEIILVGVEGGGGRLCIMVVCRGHHAINFGVFLH